MPQSYSDERPRTPPRRRRRRRKTKWQIFKEHYLPGISIILAGLLILGLIIGLIVSAVSGGDEETVPLLTPGETEETGPNAAEVLDPAALLAAQYDYDGAIALLETFTGSDSRVDAALTQYTEAKSQLLPWADNTKIPHISFQNLIVDTKRAFDGDTASKKYAKNNLTVEEFRAALQQMYAKGYVLVSMTQIAAPNESGTFLSQPIYLPAGKTPLVISLLPASYSLDKAGDGFARSLTLDQDGKLVAEYIDSTATRLYGAYDMISVLEEFIDQNPGFSYQGARAIIGVDGDGDPFGYDMEDPEDTDQLKAVVQALKETGYEFASFTYGGVRYGDVEAEKVATDAKAWEDAFTGLLGDVQILIYAGGSDLLEYEGSKYDSLYAAGFRYFIGMDNNSKATGQLTDNYYRQTRRTINGTRITEDAKLVEDLFDARSILSSDRPN